MSRTFSGRGQEEEESTRAPRKYTLSTVLLDRRTSYFKKGVDGGKIRKYPDTGGSRRYRVRETMYSERMCSAARAEESGRAASSRFPRLTNAFALRAV